MATYICKGKGTVSGLNNGGAGNDAFNGTKALANAINAGTVHGDDIVRFEGAFGLAEMADWPCGRLVSEKLQANTPGHGGVYFGTGMGSTSTASGIRFEFTGPNGQSTWDMAGATSETERMVAALRIQGEDITVDSVDIRPADWNYIFGAAGATRIAGVSAATDAEQRSDENMGLMLMGNGNTVDGGTIDGTGSSSRFCRFGVYKCPSQANVSGASSNKTGYTRNLTVRGVGSGGQCQPFGGGSQANGDMYDLKPGTREYFHDLVISGGAWGISPTYLTSGAGNAAKHGNGWGISGRFFGGAEIYDCNVSGGFQDGFGVGVAAGAVVRDNYIHDLNQQTVTWWVWNTTTAKWEQATVADNHEGNGIKFGLLNKDGGSPTTWLGDDGTIPALGDNLRVAEMRNIIVRNRIYRVNGAGITSNMSRGGVVHANEIDSTGGTGLLLVGMSGQEPGNVWISNNFVRKKDLAYSYQNDCLRIEAQYRVWLYNNILWSDPATSSYDLYNESSLALVSAGNLLVTGRTRGSTAYSGSSDLAAQTPAWTQGVGLASSSPILGAGSPLAFDARTYGITRNRMKARFTLAAPNVGPY